MKSSQEHQEFSVDAAFGLLVVAVAGVTGPNTKVGNAQLAWTRLKLKFAHCGGANLTLVVKVTQPM